jgi:RimJ/RimL family protein N-acetyltransferase
MSGVVLNDEVVLLRPLSLADVDEWMAGEDNEQMASWSVGGPVRQWAVCDATSGRILGGVEVRDLGGGEVNLSNVVFPAFRRRGIATRAATLVLGYAVKEMGSQTAIVKVLEENRASLRVARRLGAVEIGTQPSKAGGTFIVFRCDLTETEVP